MSTGSASAPKSLSSRRYSVARIRAILVGVLNSMSAILHASMLVSSLSVTAMIMSASSAPASRNTTGYEADRKSGVPGKSVSVRVGLGGGRKIEKKKQ